MMWFLASFLLLSITVCGMATILRVWYRSQAGRCRSSELMKGKTVVITGSSAGIGKETALDLAFRGAKVILACRNIEKAQKVADMIRSSTGNDHIVVHKLDTSSLTSVREFAKEILKTEESLHVLINNAGMAAPPLKKLTEDGLEMTMATNHYGHFLLTNLLLGLLQKSSPSRIINVSSVAHQLCDKIDPEDLNFEKQKYSHFTPYKQSKLCNILFTLELSEKLKGTGVTVNSLHPGLVSTEIFEKNGTFMYRILDYIAWLFGKDPTLGAQTTIHLAVSKELEGVTGKYFSDCQMKSPSPLATHRGMAKKLWLASELDVKLLPEETSF